MMSEPNRKQGLTRALLVVACILAVLIPNAAFAGKRPDWMVVTRPMFVEAIQPLADLRRQGGYDVVISTDPIAEAMKKPPEALNCLLIVGDYESGKEDAPWCVPPRIMELYRWRKSQDREFASDTAWGDTNGDLAPDVPVGRLPVRTVEQLKTVVAKILAYESRAPTPESLRLPIWSGAPSYGAAIDSMASNLLLTHVNTNSPRWCEPWLLCGDGASSFCGWPPDQPALYMRSVKEGCLIAAMMGHGNWHCFYSMSHKPRSIRYTLNHAMTGLAEGEPVPPLVIFACTTGHFAREADCLTEALLLAPGGPVAAVGATTESHPLMNYYAGVCLLKALNGKHPTIGELWETAQSRAVKAHDPLMEPLLRDVEGKLEENINIPKLRRDQLLMYALLGDPATRIKFPLPLKVDVERREDGWRWRVQRPDAATRLRVGTREPKPRPPAPKSTEEEEMRALQVKANSIFRFDTIAELGPDDKWEGTVAKGGLFRFVAWGNGALYTGTLEIEEPPDSRAQ